MVKKIIYISSVFPEKTFPKYKTSISIAAAKFNSLLIKGFMKNGYKVIHFGTNIKDVKQEKDFYITEDGVRYYIHNDVNQGLKYLIRMYTMLKWMSKECRKKDSLAFVCDYLNYLKTFAALILGKVRKIPVILIVTDLPEFLGDYSLKDKHNLREWLYVRIGHFLLQFADGYVFLTSAMNSKINKKKKPYIIMEGVVDSSFSVCKAENNSKIIMYAGSLHREYGVANLIKAFEGLKGDNVYLHIYGKGNFDKQIAELCQTNTHIKYFGLVENEKILIEMNKVAILVNPRPTDAEYTKYSFPSKNMEYMSSGIPFLCTLLTGMDEYRDYVTIVEDETEKGIRDGLEEILDNYSTAVQQAEELQKYVRLNKNEVVQSRRILNLIQQVKVMLD